VASGAAVAKDRTPGGSFAAVARANEGVIFRRSRLPRKIIAK